MEDLAFYLEDVYFGNTVEAYLNALAILVIAFVLIKIFENVVVKRIQKVAEGTKTDLDDLLIKSTEDIPASLYLFLAFYVASRPLNFPDIVDTVVYFFLVILIAYAAIKVLDDVIDYFTARAAHKRGKEPASYYGIKIIIKIILWSTGVLLVLSNLGVDITALVASLGIGGIAVALAAQNILGDIFSSFSIYMDKPFEVGDYIVTGAHRGTVKKIGIKTTRLTSLDGEEIVISNKELTETRVQNFRKLKKRRAVFQIGVTYDTPQAKVKAIPKYAKEIITKLKSTDFDRAHFAKFGDSALLFEIVYFVKSDIYKDAMDAQEKINLELLKLFRKEGIEFAFPTQTLHIEQD